MLEKGPLGMKTLTYLKFEKALYFVNRLFFSKQNPAKKRVNEGQFWTAPPADTPMYIIFIIMLFFLHFFI